MRRVSGFTLLELTVVLAVLAVAASMVLPRLGDLGRLRIEAAARRLAESVTLARDRAILGGRPARLVLDVDRGRWTAGDRERGTLPAGVRFRAVSAGDAPAVRAGVVALDLDPAGDPLAARFDLTDGRGHAASVVVPPAGGRARVVGR
jgi:general secretion pathway protein H